MVRHWALDPASEGSSPSPSTISLFRRKMKISDSQCVTIVGLQYGDEGKGKIVDAIADNFDIFVRFNGGPNAGHTIYKDNKQYKLHQIPSGIFSGKEIKTLVIGPECFVDIKKLCQEISMLNTDNIKVRVAIDERATIISCIDIQKDQEKKDVKGSIGTTGVGMGPAAARRCMRESHTAADVNMRINQTVETYELKSLLNEFRSQIDIYDTVEIVNHHLNAGSRILFEGAQSIGLDLIHGEYPYVSQRCMPANILTSFGMHKSLRDMHIIGVMKPYVTRSGAGFLRGEMSDQDAAVMRIHGNEFGATTGRPRRCGWLSCCQLYPAINISGCQEIILTKLDILAESDKYPTCKEDGGIPIYTYEPETKWINRAILPKFNDIKNGANKFVSELQKHINAPITWVSYGHNRGQEVAWKNNDFQW